MSGKHTISFGQPLLGLEELEAVANVLSGTQLVHGPVAKAFEQEFAKRMGVAHAITVSSCTAGLHLGLHVHKIGQGDEVIVPAMTHVATAHAVEYCGAKPVFVDVLPESGNINPDAVSAALSERTRAVTLVHYLGLPCDLDEIRPVADKADAFLVEDCALAVDATYDGVKVGGLGNLGVFSFYPVKHITTGEGGMVTTNDDGLAARISQMKAFGYDRALGERLKPGIYDVVALGYNYRMSELHAAVGLAQMAKLDSMQEARASNYSRLASLLADVEELTVFSPVQGKSKSSHYCLNAVLPRDGSIDRDTIVQYLKDHGIGSSVHYPRAVPLFSYYQEKYGYKSGSFPIAEWLADKTISLPVGPHLDADAPVRIASVLKDAIVNVRK